jgi:hypothetical protein
MAARLNSIQSQMRPLPSRGGQAESGRYKTKNRGPLMRCWNAVIAVDDAFFHYEEYVFGLADIL